MTYFVKTKDQVLEFKNYEEAILFIEQQIVAEHKIRLFVGEEVVVSFTLLERE